MDWKLYTLEVKQACEILRKIGETEFDVRVSLARLARELAKLQQFRRTFQIENSGRFYCSNLPEDLIPFLSLPDWSERLLNLGDKLLQVSGTLINLVQIPFSLTISLALCM